MNNATTQSKIIMSAMVFRFNPDRRPFFISKNIWYKLGLMRFPGTGRWEDMGVIASSEDGTASISN